MRGGPTFESFEAFKARRRADVVRGPTATDLHRRTLVRSAPHDAEGRERNAAACTVCGLPFNSPAHTSRSR